MGAGVTLVDRAMPELGDGPQQALKLAALRASAAKAHDVRSSAPFGITTGAAKIGMRAVQERALSVAREVAPVSSRERLAALGIEVVSGETTFIDANTLSVAGVSYRPRAIVLATGALPMVPSIPGLADIEFFTPDTILENTRKLTHLLVIGGDDAALSFSQTAVRLGAEVTYVPQGRALPHYDSETAAILLNAISTEGVRILDGASVTEIIPRAQGTGAVVTLSDGNMQSLDVSHVLVAAGRSPDVSALDMEKARLKLQHGHYAIGQRGETSNRRVRAVGPAAGLNQWQHALRHGRAVINGLVAGSGPHQIPPQPRLVMAEPELAEIGMMPRGGQMRPGCHLYRESLFENDAALAIGRAEGLLKLAVNDKGHLVGASVVGAGAADLAAVLALAMENGVPIGALANLSVPDPSLMSVLVRVGQRHTGGHKPGGLTARLRSIRKFFPK